MYRAQRSSLYKAKYQVKKYKYGQIGTYKNADAWMRLEGVFVSYTDITSSPRASQSTPSTALELGSWVEQKTAVGKLVIHKYIV